MRRTFARRLRAGAASSSDAAAGQQQQQQQQQQAGGGGAGAGTGAVMTEMMETMLRNPEMQKMLYPYLPEPMRNPQSIEWMLNTPEVRLAGGGGSTFAFSLQGVVAGGKSPPPFTRRRQCRGNGRLRVRRGL